MLPTESGAPSFTLSATPNQKFNLSEIQRKRIILALSGKPTPYVHKNISKKKLHSNPQRKASFFCIFYLVLSIQVINSLMTFPLNFFI